MQEKIPFLITKITIPPVRERRVGRARLFDRLASYPKSGLVLVSAPAGYGKTSLLAEWCNLLGQQHTALTIAWLSLDEGDNNIFRFWTGIASAFQGLPKYDLVAKRFLERLQSNSQPGPYLEYPLRLFINDLAQNQCESIIILDDYHFISNPEIQQSILFFLNNLPSRVCLVLSTRNNPSSPILTGSAIAALPVARLRARGQILELTASDLRFTSEETGRFLTGVMNLNLNPDDVAYLDHQTEGWPAGLQLAALSLKGDPSPQSIQRFQGSDRYILEYMTQEVLNHQKPEIRDFLLQTSILSRMCAPLCETLTGKPSQAILEQIEASNLFIIPLDRRREWYRYHHLFAELLLDILTRTNRDLLTSLNRKAAIWFHQNGFTDEAIAHGVISDPDLAGYWVENSILDLITQMEVDTAQRWLKSLPPSIVMTRPGLCLAWAWIFLLQLKNSQCEMWVNQATEVIKKLSPNVSSPEEIRSFHGQIAAIRSTLAIAQSDNASALEFAHQALADLPDRLARLHALVQLNIGDALQQSDATTAAKTLAF